MTVGDRIHRKEFLGPFHSAPAQTDLGLALAYACQRNYNERKEKTSCQGVQR